MIINENTKIIGKNVVLVPYMKHHVKKYHEWMKSEELQKQTASEPLSLAQEFEMQQSWRNDYDKCTFIVLERSILSKTNNEVEAMIGDTNIFLCHLDNTIGEVEIMIAETSARRKNYGWEAVLLMIYYGIEKLHITQYQAKIGMDNFISLSLFKKLQFKELSKSDIFQEITLFKVVDDDWKSWILSNIEQNICTVYK